MKRNLQRLALLLLSALPIPSVAVPARDKMNLIRGEGRLSERKQSGNKALDKLVGELHRSGLINGDLKNAVPPEPSHRN